MRTLNIVLTDREYSSLEKMKARSTWRELMQDLIKDFEKLEQQLESAEVGVLKEINLTERIETPQIPIIIEEQCENRIHKEMALKRKEKDLDKLNKVELRHKLGANKK